ncbi:UNVERIFIED_CONTAM: hypothetical protein GTU68_025566, partial [Idotea baltica]|nr:hypothetical protein [Idotea baltica]
ILHIDSSAHYETSKSRAASAKIVADLLEEGDTLTYRDLTAYPLPQIDAAWADASDQAVLTLSDTVVEEIQKADTIIIGAPMYNFSGPASLKAWMDLVARPRVTFSYTFSGPIGLLNNKKAIVVIASGGVAIGSAYDFLSPHIRHFLGFLGITDVTILAAKDVLKPAII